jgi:hypothetical protein
VTAARRVRSSGSSGKEKNDVVWFKSRYLDWVIVYGPKPTQCPPQSELPLAMGCPRDLGREGGLLSRGGQPRFLVRRDIEPRLSVAVCRSSVRKRDMRSAGLDPSGADSTADGWDELVLEGTRYC